MTEKLVIYLRQPDDTATAVDYADISQRQAELILKRDRELRELKREINSKDAEIINLERELLNVRRRCNAKRWTAHLNFRQI